MRKGIIIELRNQYTYVLLNNGKMKRIKREYYHEIGQEIQLSIMNKSKLISISFVTCALIIVFVLNPFKESSNVQALSYLSLSVNPGLVLKVDNQDRIVSVSYTNQEGKDIVNKNDFVNQTLNDSVMIFIDYCFEKGYFQNNNKININVISDDSKRIEKIESQVQTLIENYLKDHQFSISIQIDKVTSSQQQTANHLGIHPTKMKLIDLVLYYNPQLDKEKLAKYSVDDLIDCLEDSGYDEEMLDRLEDEIENEEEQYFNKQSTNDKKNITEEQAKQIALTKVNGRIGEIDYEQHYNTFKVKIETNNDKEYEVNIDASNGSIISIEED